MKKLSVVPYLLFASIALPAQEEAVLRDAMKQIGPGNGALGKKIAAKDTSASEDAKKLQDLFKGTQAFWQAKSATDAVEFTSNAAEIYGKVASLIAESKWEEATAEQKKVGANCMGCHTAHREKSPDGSWKVK